MARPRRSELERAAILHLVNVKRMSVRKAATLLGVPKSTVMDWIRQGSATIHNPKLRIIAQYAIDQRALHGSEDEEEVQAAWAWFADEVEERAPGLAVFFDWNPLRHPRGAQASETAAASETLHFAFHIDQLRGAHGRWAKALSDLGTAEKEEVAKHEKAAAAKHQEREAEGALTHKTAPTQSDMEKAAKAKTEANQAAMDAADAAAKAERARSETKGAAVETAKAESDACNQAVVNVHACNTSLFNALDSLSTPAVAVGGHHVLAKHYVGEAREAWKASHELLEPTEKSPHWVQTILGEPSEEQLQQSQESARHTMEAYNQAHQALDQLFDQGTQALDQAASSLSPADIQNALSFTDQLALVLQHLMNILTPLMGAQPFSELHFAIPDPPEGGPPEPDEWDYPRLHPDAAPSDFPVGEHGPVDLDQIRDDQLVGPGEAPEPLPEGTNVPEEPPPLNDKRWVLALHRYINLIANDVPHFRAVRAVQRGIDHDFDVNQTLKGRAYHALGKSDEPVNLAEDWWYGMDDLLLLSNWSAGKVRPPGYVEGVYDDFATSPDEHTVLSGILEHVYHSAFLEAINAQLTQLGLPPAPGITDPSVLRELQELADKAAEGITHTYNRDLGSEVYTQWMELQAQRGRQMSRWWLAESVKRWADKRAEWKADQITNTEANKAYNLGVQRFVEHNAEVVPAESFEVTPDACVCDRCCQLVANNPYSLAEMQRIILPLHPHCVHFWVPAFGKPSGAVWSGQDDSLPVAAAEPWIYSEGFDFAFRPDELRVHGKWSAGGPIGAEVKAMRSDGGFTFNHRTGAKVGKGYAVSPYPEHSKVINGLPKRSDLAKYRASKAHLLSQPDHYMGGWHDKDSGKTYLDVSVVKRTPEEAEKVAKDHNQIAYYDLGKGEEVATGGTGEKLAAAERETLGPDGRRRPSGGGGGSGLRADPPGDQRGGLRPEPDGLAEAEGRLPFADWDPLKHPRGGHGRFGIGIGGAVEDLAAGKAHFEALKKEWANINAELLDYVHDPDNPKAKADLRRLKQVCVEMNHIHADPGGSPGIGLPGGPRDVVIVGGGPGGLGSAINAKADGLDTLLLEEGSHTGGQSAHSSRIENYPGFPVGVTGASLATDMREQAARLGAEMRTSTRVTGITHDPKTGLKTVELSTGEKISTRSVILAGGIAPRHLSFPGDDRPNVIYGDASQMADAGKGGSVVVIGGSNGAAQAALGAAKRGEKATIISRSPVTKGMSDYQVQAIRSNPNVHVIEGDEIGAFDDQGVTTKNGTKLPGVKAIGIFAGGGPDTSWLPPEIQRSGSAVQVDDNLQTTMPGVFAVGDIRAGGGQRVLAAAADGQVAEHHAFDYVPQVGSSVVASAEDGERGKYDQILQRLLDVDLENPYFSSLDLEPDVKASERLERAMRQVGVAMGLSEEDTAARLLPFAERGDASGLARAVRKLRLADWDPLKHPRGGHGEFGVGISSLLTSAPGARLSRAAGTGLQHGVINPWKKPLGNATLEAQRDAWNDMLRDLNQNGWREKRERFPAAAPAMPPPTSWLVGEDRERSQPVAGPTHDITGAADVSGQLAKAAKEHVSYDLAKRSGLSPEETSHWLHAWSISSSDHESEPLALQKAMSDKFGVPLPDFLEKAIGEQGHQPGVGADPVDDAMVAKARKVVDAMYEATQEELKAKGVTHVTVYRGVGFNNPPKPSDSPSAPHNPDSSNRPPGWDFLTERGYHSGTPQTLTADTNPMSSWSLDPQVADRFAIQHDGGGGAGVMTTTVPAERVLATPFTGVGSLAEREFTLVGGPVEATVQEPGPNLDGMVSVGKDSAEMDYEGSLR